MGDLVAFRHRDRTQQLQVEDAMSGGEARILLFTGVRYERSESPVGTGAPADSQPGPNSIGGAGGGKKRKRG
jgi:hypothetical protein